MNAWVLITAATVVAADLAEAQTAASSVLTAARSTRIDSMFRREIRPGAPGCAIAGMV